MAHPIPSAALANHIAILGKTGSGKTSTEKLAVEQVVADGVRVCVLDPIKSDWWGVTSSADGKRPGLPFRILGGPRGHVPLHSGTGAVIGQLVGSGKLPLSIIDMADFEPGGLQRFFVDFAPALMKHARGVVYLVIEEAHEFAPKERAGIGAENLAIHWAKKLATAGRSKGIRLIVSTQRVQALHNAVLGSCETVITHRLTAPADQEPVIKWLKANTDKETQERVASSLSSLPTGTGWVCSGEAQIFEKVGFPKFSTYDNTATPTGDGDEVAVKTAAVDQDELRSIIGEAVREAEANDPKALRAEIAKLTAALAKAKPAGPAPEAIKEAEARGYAHGMQSGRRVALQDVARQLTAKFGVIVSDIHGAAETIVPNAALVHAAPLPMAATVRSPTSTVATPRVPAKQPSDGDTSLTSPQRHLLAALAWWAIIGHAEPTRTQVAAIAQWKPSGSNLRNRLSELSNLGLVEYPRPGHVKLSPAGDAAAPMPDTSLSLIDSVKATLTAPQLTVFEALAAWDGEISRLELADKIGWQPGGSNIRNRLSELSALELVEYPSRGAVQLQPWVIA